VGERRFDRRGGVRLLNAGTRSGGDPVDILAGLQAQFCIGDVSSEFIAVGDVGPLVRLRKRITDLNGPSPVVDA
jgi:hypothetical protein